MKKVDQGHLHPLLEQPKTDMSQPGIEPGWELVNSYTENKLVKI